MSGGSYDYVGLITDFDGYIEKHWQADHYLPEMGDALRTRFGAEDVADDINSLLAFIAVVAKQIDAQFAELQPVLRALEWHDSNDWSADQVQEAIAKYREGACECWTCRQERADKMEPVERFTYMASQMVVCATCGNKRCPHGTDHKLTCTGSNESGQPGSRYV